MIHSLFSGKKYLLVASLGIAALLSPTPSRAAIVGCAGQNTASFTWGEIKNLAGFTCTVDDKVYSNFSYSSTLNYYTGGASSGVDDADSFSLSTIGLGGSIHNLNVQSIGDYNNSRVILSYNVAVSSGSNVFQKYSGNITGDNLASWGLGVTATNSPSSSTTPGFPSTLGQAATTPNVYFNPNTTVATFNNEVLAGASAVGVTQFSNRLTQAVPGPLSILGTGAVFGFSRRLRRRVKFAA